MAIYSIKDLEKLCGIKAHTIRIWEQRYGLIKPERTCTNIRYYKDTDFKLLLNIALLNRNGLRISKIAEMSEAEIAEQVATISTHDFDPDTGLDALMISIIEMDEYKFDRIISSKIQQLGFEETMLQVIYPFLNKLSVLWLTGSINSVQENFMTCLVRQKIIAAIDKEPIALGKNIKKFLIYLPEKESQELSLLFMQYVLKARKNRVVYLGLNISVNDLAAAYKIHQPDYIFTMITETYSKNPVQKYVDELSDTFKDCQILLSGYQVVAQKVRSIGNIKVLKSLDEAIQLLDNNT